jgi:type III restriction enzyme
MVDANGKTEALGFKRSKELWAHLRTAGYVDTEGKEQDSLRRGLKAGTLALPTKFEVQRTQEEEVLRKVSGRLEIKDADERQTVSTRQAVLDGDGFKVLWDRIKHKTA